MIKHYTQLGPVNIYSKKEFLDVVDTENLPSSLYNTPYVYFDDTYDDIGGLAPSMKIRNRQYDTGLNLQLQSDEFLEKGNLNNIMDIIYEITYGTEDVSVVLSKGIAYIYSSPVKIMFDGKWQIIDRKMDKVYSIPIKGSGIKGISKIKATRLAKKMYPNAEIDGDWLYIC